MRVNPPLEMTAKHHSFREESLPEAAWEDLERLEIRRRELRARRREGKQILGPAALVAILSFFALKTLLPYDGLFLAIVLPLLGFMAVGILVSERNFKLGEADYRQAFKRRSLAVILAALAEEVRFGTVPGLGRDWFSASRLFAVMPDRYQAGDLLAGQLGRAVFKFKEIELEEDLRNEEEIRRKKKARLVSFRGLLWVVDLQKNLRAELTVMPAVKEPYFDLLGEKLQAAGGDICEMKNADFAKFFVVRSSETAVVQDFLTPAIQGRLVALRRELGVDFRFSWHGSRLWLAFPQNSAWFAGDWRLAANDRGQMREILGQIRSFLQIIEDLDSNRQIWTSE